MGWDWLITQKVTLISLKPEEECNCKCACVYRNMQAHMYAHQHTRVPNQIPCSQNIHIHRHASVGVAHATYT